MIDRNSNPWSQTWNIFLTIYTLIWLVVFGIGLRYLWQWPPPGFSPLGFIVPGLISGIGGTVGLLVTLFQHSVAKQESEHPPVKFYLVRPLFSFFLGPAIYFVGNAVYFVVLAIVDLGDDAGIGPRFSLLYGVLLLLSLVAGFFDHRTSAWLDRMMAAISPK